LAAPEPVSATTCAPTSSRPLRAPVVNGANATVTAHVARPAKTPPQVLAAMLKPVPVTVAGSANPASPGL
jgi:hypothetical protein